MLERADLAQPFLVAPGLGGEFFQASLDGLEIARVLGEAGLVGDDQKVIREQLPQLRGDISGGRINEALEPWVAGALLVLVTIGAVTTVGRIIRRGARAVGLGFVDRVGGGLLGATEGVLVVVVLIMLVGDRIGRDHPAIANTRTLAALEEMDLLASEAPPVEIDVASPPKSD